MEPAVEKAESIMDWNTPAKLSPDRSPCAILTEKRQKIKDPLKHFPGTQDMLCLHAPEKWTHGHGLTTPFHHKSPDSPFTVHPQL